MILAGLAIFAGLSLNVLLQFALGAGDAGKGRVMPLYQIGCLFVSVVFLWIINSTILNYLPWEFMAYFLMFPLSALVCLGLESLEKRIFPKKAGVRLFSAQTAYNGLVPASLVLTVRIAVNFSDALILSFFFALGVLAAVIFVREIRRRASLEEIPEMFRGTPLAFISLGLLSMISGAVAWICYRVLDKL